MLPTLFPVSPGSDCGDTDGNTHNIVGCLEPMGAGPVGK